MKIKEIMEFCDPRMLIYHPIIDEQFMERY